MHCDQSIYLWIQKFARNIVYFFKFYLGGADPEVTMEKSKSQRGRLTLKSNCVCAVDMWPR
jgi:hypothetical protein